MNILELKNLSKSYEKKQTLFDGFNLEVKKGEVCSLVGHSGSGKSTLLKLISGLDRISSGEISLNGKLVDSKKIFVVPEKRKIGYLFQDFALFPHLSVEQNIAFGISKKEDAKKIVGELLELLKLENYNKKYPHELSGGEQQRVALARALAPKPSILLLDEPFSSLDSNIKNNLRDYIFEVIRKTNVTCIFVTHDIHDAMAVSDKIVVLEKGKLIQAASPKNLFHQPKNLYVAKFFGELNVLNQEILESFGIENSLKFTYCIRPNKFKFSDVEGKHSLKGIINKSIFMGDYCLLEVRIQEKYNLKVEVQIEDYTFEKVVYLSVNKENVLCL